MASFKEMSTLRTSEQPKPAGTRAIFTRPTEILSRIFSHNKRLNMCGVRLFRGTPTALTARLDFHAAVLTLLWDVFLWVLVACWRQIYQLLAVVGYSAPARASLISSAAYSHLGFFPDDGRMLGIRRLICEPKLAVMPPPVVYWSCNAPSKLEVDQ